MDLAKVLAETLQFNLSFLPSNVSFEVDLATFEVRGASVDVRMKYPKRLAWPNFMGKVHLGTHWSI